MLRLPDFYSSISGLLCLDYQTFMPRYLDFYASITGLLCLDIWTFMLRLADFYASICGVLCFDIRTKSIQISKHETSCFEIRISSNRGITVFLYIYHNFTIFVNVFQIFCNDKLTCFFTVKASKIFLPINFFPPKVSA